MDTAPSGKDSTKARELLIAISQSIPEKAVSFTPPPGSLTDGNGGFVRDGGKATEDYMSKLISISCSPSTDTISCPENLKN
ncbi:hypothetical protein QJS04_geneDACA008779 [Acorus gramineus]|uniref:Uncharacterized protein n=1 Tax=Acorus gramineus TaxID=55184 RepID=A0AAV9ADY8_ACOGR|nr:hypothetical protein QJS04_geneDACA008779 [Acorus gramineus]